VSALLEVPRLLPVSVTGTRVGHLSHSSVRMYLRCPEKWRRRYLELEYEPSSSNLVIGKVVGAGISAGYVVKLGGEENYGEVMLDTASQSFDDIKDREEVDWQDEEPGKVKDSAMQCVGEYHQRVARFFKPTTVEEGFSITYPEADWDVQGYIDITGSGEGLAADLHDVKTVSKADGSTPSFAWHQIKKPNTRNPASVQVMTTDRTPVQINNYLARIAQVAREIDWRAETGNWQGAVPGSWFCSQKFCGFYASCPYGGVR